MHISRATFPTKQFVQKKYRQNLFIMLFSFLFPVQTFWFSGQVFSIRSLITLSETCYSCACPPPHHFLTFVVKPRFLFPRLAVPQDLRGRLWYRVLHLLTTFHYAPIPSFSLTAALSSASPTVCLRLVQVPLPIYPGIVFWSFFFLAVFVSLRLAGIILFCNEANRIALYVKRVINKGFSGMEEARIAAWRRAPSPHALGLSWL